MHAIIANQYGLEIDKGLIDFDLESLGVTIVTDANRVNILLPVLLGAQNHPAFAGRVGDPQVSLKDLRCLIQPFFRRYCYGCF